MSPLRRRLKYEFLPETEPPPVANPTDNWIRVTRDHPCPLCGKPDNCTVSRDGQMAWCGRIDQGSLRQNAGGQYLHRLDDSVSFTPSPRPSKPKRTPRRDWPGTADRLYQQGQPARQELSRTLGVSPQALDDLRVGWDPNREFWSFPERDASGKIVGINARYRNDDKIRLTGSKTGLTYVGDWNLGCGPLFLPEGGTDTAALLTMGLAAIGRPSNLGGIKLLVELLTHFPKDREIIVLAERDQKPDGRWPGKDGAISTATQLTKHLKRLSYWAFPPDDAKDVRGWLNAMPDLPTDRLADLFLTGLLRNRCDPPLTIRSVQPTGQPRDLADWRREMLAARRKSIHQPGYYLDASTTGSGKTYVDVETLCQNQSGESDP